MIPRLPRQTVLTTEIDQFLKALGKTPFSGDMQADFAHRLLTSTDNSIYQILPQAVLYPKTTEDVVEIFQLAQQSPFQTLTFAPRGGGTGTNGQSLSPGIVLDCSKYMNQVLEVNVQEAWVRVQPGVVLDQLNAQLRADGLFFAPNLSPSSRATLGGMVNTDACGKGSRLYGRTSDHLLALTWVLPDGTVGTSGSVSVDQLPELKDGHLGHIYQQVDAIVSQKQALIEQQFPKMPRFLTGYNLAKVYSGDRQHFDLNRILAGSEGTLAMITECTLKLTPIPQAQELLVVHYDCFDDALQDSQVLLALEPAAIETIDETILKLAQQNEIYDRVQSFIAGAKAINLVEFVGADAAQLKAKVQQLQRQFTGPNHSEPSQPKPGQPKPSHAAIGCYRAQNAAEINDLWALRKRGVGLLGNRKGPRKPIAFMEDTAVPPMHLSAYVQDLKILLDQYGLDYAMFGHVDVGCLHVRPALNMQVPEDERLVREISDQVVALVQRYGGVMWAEHGRGFRSEYTPLFFGEELYQDLRRIKAAFDPHNRLNPGKIVTPAGSDNRVVALEAPLRGQFDRQVPSAVQASYKGVFNCNGNGACFDVNPDQVMCPSYKGMRSRIHSPKGRASLLREWLRQLAIHPHYSGQTDGSAGEVEHPASFLVKLWHTVRKATGQYDYSHEVYDGLHGCLSCKACVSQCPIHVDIPSLKAKFLHYYHRRYLRSPRDYVMGQIERLTLGPGALFEVLLGRFPPGQSPRRFPTGQFPTGQFPTGQFPTIANRMIHNPISLGVLRTVFHLVDPPQFSVPTLKVGLKQRNAPSLEFDRLAQADPNNTVILVPDVFTSGYDAPLILAYYDLLVQLGFQVYVLPPLISGKPLHILGFLDEFAAVVQQTIDDLAPIQSLGIPMVGVEPSIVLTYRDEYVHRVDRQMGYTRKMHGNLAPDRPLPIQLPQEFLVSCGDRLPTLPPSPPYVLLGHCSEKTLAPASQRQWQQVFESAGLSLNLVETGCCGMAGLYGYEAEHWATSADIFQLSWQQHLPHQRQDHPHYLASGFSCRSQVERFSGWRPLHPIQALQQAICMSLTNERANERANEQANE